jgi:hypothetical protein
MFVFHSLFFRLSPREKKGASDCGTLWVMKLLVDIKLGICIVGTFQVFPQCARTIYTRTRHLFTICSGTEVQVC